MLKKILIVKISLIILTTIGYNQKNNIYAELGGAGYSTTINYERLFIDKILIRMGYGSGNGKSKNDNSIDARISFMPLGVAYLMDSGSHKLEIGGGTTILHGVLEMNGEYIESNAIFLGGGYRYQIGSSGFLLSLKGYYLSIGRFSSPWAGMSVGWKF